MQYFKQLMLCTTFGFAIFCSAQSTQNIIAQGNEIFTQASNQIFADKDLSAIDRINLSETCKQVRTSKGTEFTEEELIAAMNTILDGYSHKLTPEIRTAVTKIQEGLITRLRNFKVTGFAFTVDPNGAFFVDTQDPVFDMVFKNSEGEVKKKKIQALIESIGLKIEFAINLNFIFFINADFSYSDVTDTIELGIGGEIGCTPLTGVTFTYAPFKKMSGGMLMISVGFGMPGGSLSIVTGGSLTPIA